MTYSIAAPIINTKVMTDALDAHDATCLGRILVMKVCIDGHIALSIAQK
jgi:hypothetical protein